MKRIAAALIACLVCSLLVAAQGPPEMSKPGPEVKRLDYFVGTWKLEGDAKPGPFGPGGKFTETESNEWMPGGFFLVSHIEGAIAGMGKFNGLSVMGYNTEDKAYTYNGFNSMGEAEHANGTFENGTWTWTNQTKTGGKTMNGRFIIKQGSPTSYTFKFDMQPEGGEWATMMEGTATKGTAAKTK